MPQHAAVEDERRREGGRSGSEGGADPKAPFRRRARATAPLAAESRFVIEITVARTLESSMDVLSHVA